MPIDKDFNLDNPEGITEEDIREMDRQADEIEEIARRAEKAKEKIASVGAPIKDMSFAQLDVISKALGKQGTRQGDTGGDTGGGMAGMGKEELMDLIIELMKTMEEAKKERKENKEKIDEHDKEMKKLNEQLMNAERKVEKGTDDFFSLTSNPAGFIKGKLMSIAGKAGVAGAIILFMYKIAQMIYNEIMDSFKPGGANDIRKQMEDRDKEMIELKDILDRRAGRVFFTGDVDLRQGAPQYNNTERLRDQVLRYQALHIGE